MKKNIHFKKVTVAGFVTNIDNDEEKGTAHWDCNINLQLTKKVPVILYNLRGYNSDLIFSELDKFDVKTRKDFYSPTKDEKIGDDGKI